MDYHLIHPLFDNSDEDMDIAADYMVNSMLGSGSTKVGIIGDDGEPIIDQKKVRAITKEFIKNSYGKNLKTIANFGLVEEVFYEKYADSILEYLQYAGYQAYYVEMKPWMFSHIAMFKYMRDNDSIRGLAQWDPRDEWKNFAYGDNIERNIMNPTNQYASVTLVIRKLSNKGFLKALYGNNTEVLSAIFANIDAGKAVDVSIRVLPQFSYEKIFNLINMIHRYL